MFYSQWFESNYDRPTRKGVYEVQNGNFIFYSRWNGSQWGAVCTTAERASTCQLFYKGERFMTWRGIHKGD